MGGRSSSSGIERVGENISTTISRVTLSSAFSDEQLPLTRHEENLLSETVEDTQVYRGIAVLNSRLTPEQRKEILQLNPGDDVPDFITSNNKNRFTSTTEKLSVAKSYSKGGDIQLVIETKSTKDNTWANLRNISKSPLSSQFTESQKEYFNQDKEVLMKPNAKYKVKYIKAK